MKSHEPEIWRFIFLSQGERTCDRKFKNFQHEFTYDLNNKGLRKDNENRMHSEAKKYKGLRI